MGCANSTPEKTETENPSNHSAKLQPGSEPAPGGSRKAVSAEEIVARVENAGAVEKAEEEPAATIEESATTVGAADAAAAAEKAATEAAEEAAKAEAERTSMIAQEAEAEAAAKAAAEAEAAAKAAAEAEAAAKAAAEAEAAAKAAAEAEAAAQAETAEAAAKAAAEAEAEAEAEAIVAAAAAETAAQAIAAATKAAEEEAAAAKAATELVDSAVSKSLDDLDPEPEPDPEESNLFARLAGTFTKVKGFIGRLRGRKKVVILCTSAEKMPGLDGLTGAWSEEVTTPFYLFTEKGCEVTLASINGGKVPIDAASLGEGFKSESDTKFEENGDLSKLESTVEISSISPDDFDCIFLAGGHGTVVDFPDGAADIVTKAYARGRYVAAVCHGPFGLLNATAHDTALVAGKKVCGFSNEEEAAVVGMRGLDPPPPSLEDALKSLGGEYVPGEAWAPNAIRDGNLITGQNPKSAGKVAELCLEAMGL